MGGRGSSSGMGGGGSRGAQGGGVLTRAEFNNELQDIKNSGNALTSQDSARFGAMLDRADNGSTIQAYEHNSYYLITETYTKRSSGWQYVRENQSNGDIYENRLVTSVGVANNVLSTARSNDPLVWSYRPGKP